MALAWRAGAQIQVAGTLLVNIDPTGLPAGPTLAITNSGSTGGWFAATGLGTLNQPVVVSVGGGANGIMFDGSNFMQQAVSPTGVAMALPAPLTGVNSPYSIECWVVNPTTWTGGDEAMVSWGVQGSAGFQTTFGYSAYTNSGAMDHNANNMYWAAVPAMGVWHHLVYTFDGTNQALYRDGVLDSTYAITGNLTPLASQPITLAAERTSGGALVGVGGVRGALILGKARIHSAALSAAQVFNNFSEEAATFAMAPVYPGAKPIHRYSFNNASTTNAVGATLSDTGTPGGANGVVRGTAGFSQFSGTKLMLSGGSSATAGYADLPNGLLSGLSVNNGGTGQVTLEGWVQLTGAQTWARLFDIGAASTGEITNIGGTFTGVNYFCLAQNAGNRDWARCEIANNGFNGGPNVTSTKDFTMDNITCLYNGVPSGLGLTHYAVTWNEATGEVIVYLNGLEATRYTTATKFNGINDVNFWLGRSNFNTDANAQCAYDEFRIYNTILSPAQVQYDYQAGPTVVNAASGALQAIHLQLPHTTLLQGAPDQAGLKGDYINASGLALPANLGTYSTSDPTIVTVSSNGQLQAVGPGTATISVFVGALTDSNSITVITDPGAINDIRLVGTNAMTTGVSQQTSVRGDFANISDVDMLWYNPQDILIYSSTSNITSCTSNGLVSALSPGRGFIVANELSNTLTSGLLITVTSGASKFTFDNYNDAYWSIINQANSNSLVDFATGASQAVATNTALDKQFQLLFNLPNGSFRIRNHASWQCIGAQAGGTSPGAGVVPITYNGSSLQQWYFQDVGNNYFRIVNGGSGLALQTDNGNPASVTLQPVSTSPLQYWRFSYQTNYPKKGTASYDGDPRFQQTSWVYDWGGGSGPALTNGETYVPMLWGPSSSRSWLPGTFTTLAKPQYILGFNEPDNSTQANMTEGSAAQIWPTLLGANVPLVSPGAQNNTDAWMFEYFAEMQNNNYRVDYTTTHLYVPPNAGSVIGDLQANLNDWGRPVWLTEFSPVDWSNTKGWSTVSNYNFLWEFMWRAEDTPWLRHYSMFLFSASDELTNNQWVNTGQRGNAFLADGSTLTPYGELYATWDADRVLHARTPYLLHNLGTGFRMMDTNTFTTPQSSTLYVRDARTEWSLVNAPITNHWYIISLSDGRRLRNIGGALSLAPFGAVGSQVEWVINGPDSTGNYSLNNPAAGNNVSGTGSPPAISWTSVSGTPNANAMFRFIKPFQPVAIPAAVTPANVSLMFTNSGIALNWSGGNLYYNVYRSGTQGGPYTLIAGSLSTPTFTDTTASSNTVPEYYVVTGLNILADESAISTEVAATAGGAWRQQWFGSIANTGSAADSANPSGDGIVNLLKRAFNLNPLVVVTSGLPTGAVSPDGTTFIMTYQKSVAATDLIFQAQTCTDMNSWSPTGITDVVVSSDGVTEIHAASVSVANAMQFMRLQVTTTP